jgi:colanic acid/amylovoran biosynthesis protein
VGSPHFLLVGNGPYTNRGCEAIVRGTMVILRAEFGPDVEATLASFGNPQSVVQQAATEVDPLITHVALSTERCARWSPAWWRRQLLTRWVPSLDTSYSMLDRFCSDASCAMEIGGDNYTLDYGPPSGFMCLDAYLRRQRVPIVLWGASVGPFESDPVFAPKMFAHLRAMRAILVRESDSYEYLRQHGFDGGLYPMSDPAFLMDPAEPQADKIGCLIPPEAIGLNLSPLMAKHVAGGDLNAWVRLSADIVRALVETTRRDVLLVPHVTCVHSNDHTFLRGVADTCPQMSAGRVFCLDGRLTAAETKWVISKCAVFVGARTHSTIAAISSGVPTLSLAYSRKARGLNRDIFGSQDYCLEPSEVSPGNIARRIVDLLAQSDTVADHLTQVLPRIRERALRSGRILHRLIEEPDDLCSPRI